MENRTWAPPSHAIGQLVALHSSQRWDDAGERFIEGIVGRAPTPEECPRGAIVGVVRLVGVLREGGKCTRPGDARWYMGAVGWLLDDPIALEEPILHTGSLGLRFLAPRIERLVLDSPELRSA